MQVFVIRPTILHWFFFHKLVSNNIYITLYNIFMIVTINYFVFIIHRVIAQAFNYYWRQYHQWEEFITIISEVSVVVLDVVLNSKRNLFLWLIWIEINIFFVMVLNWEISQALSNDHQIRNCIGQLFLNTVIIASAIFVHISEGRASFIAVYDRVNKHNKDCFQIYNNCFNTI